MGTDESTPLLNSLRKRDKMLDKPRVLSLFRNEFNKFNGTRARMLDGSLEHPKHMLKLMGKKIFTI